VRAEGYFLANLNGNRLDKNEVHRTFYTLSRQIGLRAVDASRGPRLHDFRNRFAVETLLRWHRNGEDTKRRLPILSTYLGHAHVTDTYWNLTGTPELYVCAEGRVRSPFQAKRVPSDTLTWLKPTLCRRNNELSTRRAARPAVPEVPKSIQYP
jgi:hypothetical protein